MLLGSYTRQGAAPCLRSSSLYGLSKVTPLSLNVLLYTVSLNEVSTKSLPGLLDFVSLCVTLEWPHLEPSTLGG